MDLENLKLNTGLGSELVLACRTQAHVLITGQTGTGKSRLARKIHEFSSRSLAPFVTVNLATLHEGTLESELFGHERGAFTGADLKRKGRLEQAQGGTVFLDEIGELPLKLQARLLEFLQSGRITPVGSNQEIKLNVRVIAATQRNLLLEIKEGRFREDLFQRLRVVELKLPTLLERSAEFGEVLHSCLESLSHSLGVKIKKIDEKVARSFEAYHWPGNYRELRNVLEYSILSVGTLSHTQNNGVIECGNLPQWFREYTNKIMTQANDHQLLGVSEIYLWMNAEKTIKDFERLYFEKALKRNDWKMNQTAKSIGINKTTFLRRVKDLKIHPSLTHS